MNLLKNAEVQQYLSLFGEKSPVYSTIIMFDCRCIIDKAPNDAHSVVATPIDTFMAELAASQGTTNLRSVVTYLTKTSYLHSDTMQFLVDKMLQSSEIKTVERYYNILDCNFTMHPPCAPYMKAEYENLMLTPYRSCFKEMTLWGFLFDSFNQITNGSIPYGENKVSDFAFNRCLKFSISILHTDFEVSKINNYKPLIMKCLNYNPERKSRMSEITKLLDKLYNTGYDFQGLVIDLAHLINQIK